MVPVDSGLCFNQGSPGLAWVGLLGVLKRKHGPRDDSFLMFEESPP